MQADRLTKALRKGNAEPFADDQGELQLGGRFVWKKKIERELQDGARTKDIYERERMNTEAERKVSSGPISAPHFPFCRSPSWCLSTLIAGTQLPRLCAEQGLGCNPFTL